MPWTIKPALALCLALLLPGCTQWHYELGTPLASSDTEWAEGTPVHDLLLRLGPPQRISSTPQGYVMAWEYWRVRENSLGISLGAVGADVLSIDLGEALVSGQYLVATFDRDHRLAAAGYSAWSGSRGRGRAIQPPTFGAADLTNVDDLVEPLPTHHWGAALLDPLPESLNQANAPGRGDTGLEQRGTPTGTGQRALEMD